MGETVADTEARRRWMGVMARADAAALATAVAALGPLPHATPLRGPEIGAVMVRGRAGGSGGAFNLGEMTVTRCSLRLDCGTVGHAVVQGRDRDKARTAALLDAVMQTTRAAEVEAAVVAPLEAAETARRRARTAKAEATRVDFFTLVRGED